MVNAILVRQYFDTHTLGVFVAIDNLSNVIMTCSVLELPWIDNQRKISCIPEGTYKVQSETNVKFGKCYRILNVPGRDGILQHPGNYTKQILGCQLPGLKFTNLDSDSIPDIEQSRVTLDRMLAKLGDNYVLNIISEKI
jgi:Family of unknown function (DUF5675)